MIMVYCPIGGKNGGGKESVIFPVEVGYQIVLVNTYLVSDKGMNP